MILTLDGYEAAGILTAKAGLSKRVRQQEDFAASVRRLRRVEITRAAVVERKNILVVGATGSGKTTLRDAILDTAAELTPSDRVISIEDTTELQCRVRNHLDLRAAGEVTMLQRVRACTRLEPSRIVVGEVSVAEAHTLLKAWNTGHPSEPSIEAFRTVRRFGGDGIRVVLAYAVYPAAHGVDMEGVKVTSRSRDLGYKGNEKRHSDYIKRAVRKALASVERGRGR